VPELVRFVAGIRRDQAAVDVDDRRTESICSHKALIADRFGIAVATPEEILAQECAF